MKNPIVDSAWSSMPGDRYLVIGKDREGKRFRLEYTTWPQARCINVWNGNKWLVRGGKRFLIQRIVN